MTDATAGTATRPSAERGAVVSPDSLLALRAGVVAAVNAAGVGLAVVAALVLLGWGTDTRSSGSGLDATRAAGEAWLLAHHSPLGLPSGTVGLVPMGLLALPVALLMRAGAALGREIRPARAGELARTVLLLVAPYALVAVVVAKAAGGGAARVGPLSAVLGASVVALVAGGVGVLRGAGQVGVLTARLPRWAPAVLGGGAAALVALTVAGGLITIAALVLHAGRMVSLSQSLQPGVVGGVLLGVLGLLLFPNAAVCGAGYATGAGFAVGAGTSVSVFGAHLGPVPALPLLAALPGDGRPSMAVWPVLLAPVIAGIIAGRTVARRLPDPALSRLAGAGAGTGVAAAAGAAGLAVLAGGPLGAGRLAALGPSPWRFAVVVGAEIALVAAVAAPLTRWRVQRADTAETAANLDRSRDHLPEDGTESTVELPDLSDGE